MSNDNKPQVGRITFSNVPVEPILPFADSTLQVTDTIQDKDKRIKELEQAINEIASLISSDDIDDRSASELASAILIILEETG